MGEWKECKLGDISEIQTGPFGSQLHAADYELAGIPTIMPTNIGTRLEINRNGLAFINKNDAQRLNKYLVKEGDIVYSRRGDVEKCAFISIHEDGWLCGTGCLRVRIKAKDVESKFIALLLSTENIKTWVSNNAVGTTMPNLNTSILQRVPIILPPLPEQTAIASVLSSLDNKIDLLHRQNATLEKMAETLFRQWFVEEAKEGWEMGKLSDLVVVKYGKDHKKLIDGNIPVFGSGGLMRFAEKFLCDKESVLIPRKGSLNNVMYINDPFWTVDTMFYTEMRMPNVAKFVYHFLKGQDLASMNVGSAVPSMTTEILNNMLVEIPPTEVFHRFESTVSPLYLKIKSNQTQIRTLTALRDTLLPKLMSGEVRVV